MRRLITFSCEGDRIAASLDPPRGRAAAGLLMVTGGSQTRTGSHRMYETLARSLSKTGVFCLRYDRRGVGDSDGEDRGFRSGSPEVEAASAELRRLIPADTPLFGFGLCDGATTLCLSAGRSGLDGLILANPWLAEAEAGAPPPAAIRRHYVDRLTSLEGWKRLLGGAVDIRKAMAGVARILRPPPALLAAEVADALRRHEPPVAVILGRGDATAIAAEAELKGKRFEGLYRAVIEVDSASHTFAAPGDEARLLAAVREAMARLTS